MLRSVSNPVPTGSRLPVLLRSLATALPEHVLSQADVTRHAREIFAPMFGRFPKLEEVFQNAGIEQRYSVRPLEWFLSARDFSERNAAYLQGARDLFIAATERALDRAGVLPGDVDVVVTVSSTGIATPSIDAHAAAHIGFRSDITRVPVFGMGCAGGVSGLALGGRLALGAPGAIVLVAVIELCTLAFRQDRGSKADVIASALFGDGAAAAVLQAGTPTAGIRLRAAAEHLWPGTLDIMGWTMDPIGLGVVLSRALPEFVEQRLGEPARGFASRNFQNGTARYICHPGGAKVLAAIEAALRLSEGELDVERSVLRGHGNMSAPTVLFVLEKVLDQGLSGAAVMAALGPGFTASFLGIEAVND
jgi:alkylresorcinol/alkylpyrone synthase